jgi:hypothetical protein
MQFVPIRNPFDGTDRTTVRLDRKHGARLDRSTVHDDGARAAVTGVTSNVGPGEIEFFAQIVHKKCPRLNVAAVVFAVD